MTCPAHFFRRPLPARARGQSGFTLVEMMVAVTISLLVMISMIAFLVNSSRANTELAKANSQIENGRFAIQVLQGDIAQAGFWGSLIPQFDDMTLTSVPSDVPASVPDPCLAYSVTDWTAAHKNNLLGIPVQAYEDAPSGCTSVVTDKKANTDVLVVRHADACVPGEANCSPDVAGNLYLQVSGCEAEINATPSLRYVLDTTGFTLKQRGCTGSPPATVGTLADKRKFISNLYYIRDYAVTAGDGIPTLMRSQFDLASGTLNHQAALPLIEGIEGFKVEFGVDNVSDTGASVNFSQAVAWTDPDAKTSPSNRGDGIPDGNFIRCTSASPCTADTLMNTVAARIYFLVRSREATAGYTDTKTYDLAGTTFGPFNDGFKRKVFSTTVRLVNIAGRRETP